MAATAPITVELVVHPDVALDDTALTEIAARRAGVAITDVRAVRVRRRAIDARGGRVRLRLTVEVFVLHDPPAQGTPEPADLPVLHGEPQVAIVGSGPAGLFCAWSLARQGIRSIVLERGKRVQPRRRDLATLCRQGRLDVNSNYCFGEGGAGTFSDGKLYTRASRRGPVSTILETFVGYGAARDILVDARPHIGTNRLPGVITTMRSHLEHAGVVFEFGARVDGLWMHGDRVGGVTIDRGPRVEARSVVLAPGHSARDVQRWLLDAGVPMSFKAFAMGVRVEHPQATIDQIQHGGLAGHPALGAASYRLTEQVEGCGVFSFCMCPGGFIAPAATEADGQVVNGWSPSTRRGKFANSGFVVEIGPADISRAGLDFTDPLAGVELQRRLERDAYRAGGGGFVAPAQPLASFVEGRPPGDLPPCSYPRGLAACDLQGVLRDLSTPLREALRRVGDKMPGFVTDEAVAVGVESRTSCPVRVERDTATLSVVGHSGLYACGEGAGLAGGIVSAALDGIRIAEAISRATATGSRAQVGPRRS